MMAFLDTDYAETPIILATLTEYSSLTLFFGLIRSNGPSLSASLTGKSSLVRLLHDIKTTECRS